MASCHDPRCLGRWKHHFDAPLNGAESGGNGGQDNGENIFVSTADDGNKPALILKEVVTNVCLFEFVGIFPM